MTKRFGEIGWPVGTLATVKHLTGIDEDLRGKVVKIVQAKQWHDKFEREGYLAVEINKDDVYWFCTQSMLEFRSFPVTLQNWCRTKVSLLTEIDPRIAYQLGQEKYKGTGEGSYERDFPHVPLGENK